MDVLLCILAIVCVLVGIAGSVVPALPGPPIAYLGVVLVACTSAHPYSWVALVVYGVVMAVIQVADFILPAKFTAVFGGSKYAERGSLIGTVVGMFCMPWGLIIFPFVGAFVGEWIYDKQASVGHLFKVAWGSFLAFLVGTGIKLIYACWVLVDIIIEIWGVLL